MGFHGNEIAERTIRALLKSDASTSAITEVTAELVDALRDEDWDTTEEVLNEFLDEPAVVEGFTLAGEGPWDCESCDAEE